MYNRDLPGLDRACNDRSEQSAQVKLTRLSAKAIDPQHPSQTALPRVVPFASDYALNGLQERSQRRYAQTDASPARSCKLLVSPAPIMRQTTRLARKPNALSSRIFASVERSKARSFSMSRLTRRSVGSRSADNALHQPFKDIRARLSIRVRNVNATRLGNFSVRSKTTQRTVPSEQTRRALLPTSITLRSARCVRLVRLAALRQTASSSQAALVPGVPLSLADSIHSRSSPSVLDSSAWIRKLFFRDFLVGQSRPLCLPRSLPLPSTTRGSHPHFRGMGLRPQISFAPAEVRG